MKISALRTLFHSALTPLYEKKEIDAIFFMYVDYKYNIKKHDFFLNPDNSIEFEQSDLAMLANGCPIQYVTGKTIFYNIDIKVDPSALIPRPETEELVSMIINKVKTLTVLQSYSLTVLDIGTGSGAIAIALAKNITNAKVWATDISKEALETAKINATHNNADITFLLHDILKDASKLLPENLDIIVSNPPYIPYSESSNLHKNVVNYEPNGALFVPDETPLVFYDAIASVAQKNLRAGGLLYFETYEKFHAELYALLAKKGFKEIVLWNDLNGNPRFVCCKKL
ncbi:MAG: peptide chain release factor N(5)-glutamine methyltransferase [Bacteroidetes bacterium]|nr:peptide chain release factor N(5)-glutamine methyltransferase [Bacteroidota bacterium]MCL1969294.1 peptide chain release factor N(5)-glutamine methyltransferase [Bacteroidota bacterium]